MGWSAVGRTDGRTNRQTDSKRRDTWHVAGWPWQSLAHYQPMLTKPLLGQINFWVKYFWAKPFLGENIFLQNSFFKKKI
jgi:hypothetical protein